MTKVEAIRHVLEDNNGVATWELIYNQILRYYPEARRSQEWKAGIRGVLYREIKHERSFKMMDTGIISLIDYDESNQVLKEDQQIKATTKDILMGVRVGQERFRKRILRTLKSCPITGIDDARLLNASHIKPWAVCDDNERMNIHNGFVFSLIIDRLFDRGLLTFDEGKNLILSTSLSNKNIERAGLNRHHIYKKLPIEGREPFLQFHRDNVFIG
ncbi:MAG: HNH endonuclease [Flavobacteriales bacterium]|jgi:predicted restriction endonuclease|nr:HNH endonuclease [Flavobacteriales bacterium]